jgi:hypothetical protein
MRVEFGRYPIGVGVGEGRIQMCSGTGTNLFGPPSLHICSNIHPSRHLVVAVVTTSTQLRRLFHCYHNENFLYIISPTNPGVPHDKVCFTLELLVASYRISQSPQHARERKIISLKIRKKINDTVNQKATKIQAAQLCFKAQNCPCIS